MSFTVPAIPAGTFFYDANDRRGTDLYDADGNTTSSGGLNYVYDFENHLVQQGGATFVYDGDGNRVQKIVAGNVTHYFVDSVNPSGYPQVLAEETASNFAFTNYTWGLELVSRVDFSSGQPIYFVHDGHGSVRALTNPSGAVTDTYDYDAFGNLLHQTGTTQNNYLFADEQFDPNLNLYYNRARYLSTNTGRFWSMDTHEGDDEDPTTLHKYVYSGDDPTDRRDESGNDFDIGSVVEAIDIGVTLFAFPTLTTNDYRQGGSAELRIATAQSERGESFLKCHEGSPLFCDPLLRVYDKDGSKAGNCTIGWGHKIHDGPCTDGDRAAYASFTKDAAEQFFFTDVMDKALIPIKRRVHVGLAQRELDALIDFTFNVGGANLGISVLLQQLNAGNYKQAGEGFLGWLRPATIRQRRVDEKNLWDTGRYVSNGHPIP